MADADKRMKNPYPGVTWRTDNAGVKTFYIRYRLDYVPEGRTSNEINEPVGRSDRGMTAARAASIRADRLRGKADPNTVKRSKVKAAKEAEEGRWTIAKLWDEYKSVKAIKGIKTDEGRFEKFLRPAFGGKEPHEIDQLSITRLKSKMLKTKAPQTVKNTLELLRRVVNFGVNARLSSPLPCKIEFPKCNNIVTEDLTPDQLQALLDAIEQDAHPVAGPMMLCALFTGMRRGEMFRLKWADLDFHKGFILLRGPKGGVDQTIPMNQRARELFESVPRESEFVFPGRGGNQRTDIKRPVRAIMRAAGLPEDFRALHGLRHVYASMLASSGKVDMLTLQKLMTHKSPDVTLRYAHLRDEALRSAGQVVDDLFASVGQGKAVNSSGEK